MNKKVSFIDFLPSILALLLAIGTVTVFKACPKKPDGTWMRCHHVQDMVFISSLILTAVSLIPAFLGNKIAKFSLLLLCLLATVLIMLLPGVLMPMCMMKSMRCYTVMQPFVRSMSVLLILALGWNSFKAITKNND